MYLEDSMILRYPFNCLQLYHSCVCVCVCVCVRAHAQLVSHVWFFATPWIIAHQALLPMGFSRQEYWSGSQFPLPGEFPDPKFRTLSPSYLPQFQVDSLLHEQLGKHYHYIIYKCIISKLFKYFISNWMKF